MLGVNRQNQVVFHEGKKTVAANPDFSQLTEPNTCACCGVVAQVGSSIERVCVRVCVLEQR